MAVRTKISPAKVQYPQISQLQISSCPEATSQTVPHSPWCRYISDVLVPLQNKTQNNKNWTFCVEHEQRSQNICPNPDLWMTSHKSGFGQISSERTLTCGWQKKKKKEKALIHSRRRDEKRGWVSHSKIMCRCLGITEHMKVWCI